MKKKPLKKESVELERNSKVDEKTQHRAQHLTTDLPLAEKDEEKQAEDELRQRIKNNNTD